MMKKKHFKNHLWNILFVAALCMFAYAFYNVISIHSVYRAADNEYASLAEIARSSEPNQANVAESGAVYPDAETNSVVDADVAYQSPIDFAALREINPDVIGWIYIDGTNIDYPIVRSKDNDDYLRKTFKGERNASGAIFMDYQNSPDFTDKNSIIYGHKMKNGSMFADLTDYKNQNFYESHPSFVIFTPDMEYRCDIISIYVTPGIGSRTYAMSYVNESSFSEYIDYISEGSIIRTGYMFNASDRIVTLSTCDAAFDDARMIVHAVLREVYH